MSYTHTSCPKTLFLDGKKFKMFKWGGGWGGGGSGLFWEIANQPVKL